MDLKNEVLSTAKYVIIGLILSVVINQGLGYALNANKPIMAVVSDSMVPVFYRGDLIVVKGLDCNEIEVGDIIVYQNNVKNIPIVHRVVEIIRENGGRRFFITKGDNNSHPDQEVGISPPVSCNWVRGKVALIIPKLGLFKVGLIELNSRILNQFNLQLLLLIGVGILGAALIIGAASNETKQLIIIGLLGLVIVGTALGIRAGVFEGAPVMAVVSDSMSPTINKGDLIIYKTVECGSVVEGEVIIYQNPVGLTPFAHRVTEIVGDSKNRFFITKGDGSPHSDQDLGISPPILCNQD
jgi:signal peptidase